MNKPLRIHLAIAILGIIFVTIACALPSGLTSTATPTGGVLGVLGGSGSKGGSSGGGGGVGGGGGAGNAGGGSGSSGSNAGANDGSPTQLPDINSRPYVVKQIETLGGESISGVVCNLSKPFTVLSVTPRVTFSFVFAPTSSQKGGVSYSYSIKSAGESHNASGTYTISQVDTAGTLQLSLTVSDHVVFKGFDGNIPNRYKFNLVPTGDVPCP